MKVSMSAGIPARQWMTSTIRSPFKFTGKLNKLTLRIDRPKLTPEDLKKLETVGRNNKMSE